MRTRPLSEVSPRELRGLLEEEAEHWSGELLWDYADVSAAVAGGLERRMLTGFVLQDTVRPVAYSYFMLDAGRAIVGAVFAAAGYRGQGLEEQLLDAVLREAQAQVSHDRVECQTLFSTASRGDERFLRAGFQGRTRHYLLKDLSEPIAGPPHAWRLREVRREDLPAVSQVIHRSHVGSLDAALNLTYATPGFCRGFVETLVLRAGCGHFEPGASFLAEGPSGPVGVLLASRLSATNGHICQVSVTPDVQGRGLGSVLMAATLDAFRRHGLTTASLSVTRDNRPAYHLYRRLGFTLRKEFAAHAWVRPPARIELPA